MALHEVGSNNPDGVEIKKQPKDPRTGLPLDGIYSHPYYTVKDIVGVIVFLAVFSIIVFFLPEMGGYFLEANNFIPADPLKTPEHIAPVWYFTPYYAMLRAVPSFLDTQFWGVLVMGAGGADLLRRCRGSTAARSSRSATAAALYKALARGVRRRFLILGYLGTVPVTVWGQFARRLAAATAPTARPGRAHPHDRLLPVLPADALVHGARQDEAGAGAGDVVMNSTAIVTSLPPCCCRRVRALACASGGARHAQLDSRAPVNRLDDGVAAARRAQLRQLLPQLPLGEVHALQPPDRPRAHRAADHRQPDVRDRQDRRDDDGRDDAGERQGVVRRGAARTCTVEARVRGARLAVHLSARLLSRREAADRLEQPRVPERRHAARAVATSGDEQARRDRIRGPRKGDGRRDRGARVCRWWSRSRTTSTRCSACRPTSRGR